MSVWEQYSIEQRREYIRFLEVYGALTNLFRQKKGQLIPYLDSKFQETVFAKTFNSKNVDYSNTPHDVLSIFGNDRIGIGLKTFMGSNPSFQKVMQIKSYQNEINDIRDKDTENLAYKISEIKNEILVRDHKRLGLSSDKNIYHYVTRDKGKFVINECSYPLIDLSSLRVSKPTPTSIVWSDGVKDYKYTFGDSQIWQKFDPTSKDTSVLTQFDVKIIEDPFSFLINAYLEFIGSSKESEVDIEEVYLPLYSFARQEVSEKSGLNAWNAKSKSKGSDIPRPAKEVYIPIPIEFHKKHPFFFTRINMMDIIDKLRNKEEIPEVRFHLLLPNGKKLPSLITQGNMKALQSGSSIERDEKGDLYGQGALGQWLLVDVLGLNKRQPVTREWLQKKGTDSVRLWKKKGDYSIINIDFAPIGAFEAFIKDEPIPQNEEESESLF